MKKITKASLIILLTLIMCLTGITASANEQTGITPRLSHTEDTNFSFTASSSGGDFHVYYRGLDSFARADLTVKLEKSFLFFFWTDMGTITASSTQQNGHFANTFALDGKGTYRATFTLRITGTNGTVDTVEQVIESTY